MIKNGYFKTGKRLQCALDNSDKIKGMQFYLDCQWAYLNLDMDGFKDESELPNHNDIIEVPYWALEGSIDYGMNGYTEYDPDTIKAQLRLDMYEPKQYGDIIEINDLPYEYISSIPLGEESEHQAENGECAYEYRGCSYLRILKPLFSELS